jgi:L-ascorbate metabolism protein UlaG (beta-lactamase superfamily)
MKISSIGHACFLVDAREARIVTDPFAEGIPYASPEAEADLITVSHDHFDHNAVDRIGGSPTAVTGPGEYEVDGVSIGGIASLHDDQGGAQRGANRIYVFTLEGICPARLGDLGTSLDSHQRAVLGGVEILFAPVAGHFTIDATRAAEIARSLPRLRVVIPMHYKADAIADWPIATVEEFEFLMDNVCHIGASTVEMTRTSMPEQWEVWILDHA